MKNLITLICLLFALVSAAQNPLLPSFQTPPNAAKPRVWWHWMNGNVSKDGIQKDLEWMQHVGIGGFQNFDANLMTPVVVPKKLVFMQPDWKDAFKFTTELADQKGLEMAIAGSPGWSVTGGPWVEPKDAMKKYVWTETRVKGGETFNAKLAQPADVVGKFQNASITEGGFGGGFVGKKPNFYQDAYVVAYKISDSEKLLTDLNPKITSSGGTFSLVDLTDGNVFKTTELPPKPEGEEMWLQYEFETPQTFKAFSLVGALESPLGEFNGNPENSTLKVSDDGVNFRDVAKPSGTTVPQHTVSFAPTTGKYWRLSYKSMVLDMGMAAAFFGGGKPKPNGVKIAEFNLHNTDRIDQAEDKAGFTPYKEDTKTFLPQNADAITEGVVDLTAKMGADGSLNWTAPAGNWIVLRLGYSLTGRQNHPASPEATGLEVDKLDKEAVRRYINTYLDMYKDATGGLMGAKGLQYMILDSYEAGHMNWTKDFPAEFQKRRGYAIVNWLPVLTGRIVQNTAKSEQFLWDFRKTIGEMIAENHYDLIGEELHKRSMKRYTESHEGGRIYLADGMDVKRNSDVPMSAMWTPGSLAGGSNEEIRSEADIRESASVAHIYGKPIVAAESMTSVGRPFQEHPERLKRTADLEMASGLNRFVIHTSVHQPLTEKQPGFSLGPFGQYFTRQETWSEAGGKAWMQYLGRSCFMLQQGKHVADVLVYYGENHNLTWRFKDGLPKIEGYEYDFCNATALQKMKVVNGKIVAPSGAAYSLLVLDESAKNMTLATLKKLRDLVKAGGKVAGVKPQSSPSLSDDTAAYAAVLNEIGAISQNSVEILRGSKISKDVKISNAKAPILYVHRQTADQEIYWLNSRSADANSAEISFRVSGKVPQLWHPQTGKTERVSYQIKDGRTTISLKFDGWEAYFIVFKDKATAMTYAKPASVEKQILTIGSDWQVSFQEGRGAPKSLIINKLASLSENTEGGVKYFSGTATYRTTFKMPTVKKGEIIELDLGDVKNVAEVFVNGKNVGTVWKKPFKVQITEGVKTGENVLEVKVTNTWVNRLIGDAQPDVKEKITFTTMPFYKADAALVPSGLLGPVVVSKK